MGFLDQLFGGTKKKQKAKLRLRSEISVDGPKPSITYYPELATDDGVEPIPLPLRPSDRERAEIDPDIDLRCEVLANLVFDDCVEASAGRLALPLGKVFELEEEDRHVLDLDTSQEWKLHLDVRRVIGGGRNPLALRWTTPEGEYNPDPNDFVPVPCGFYEQRRNRLHILPPEIIKIRDTVETADAQLDGSQADEYQMLGELQVLVEDALKRPDIARMLQRSKQLNKEDYKAPKKVEVDFRVTDDGLELRPILDGFEDFEDAEDLVGAGDTKRLFTKEVHTSKGKRKVRVALNQTVRREVSRIRKRRHVPKEDIEEFARDPRKYIHPPEEQAQERQQRARELGISEDEVAEREEMNDVVDLTSVADRIAEFKLEDYGKRVIGFAKAEPVKLRPSTRDGLDLDKDWLGEESSAASPRDETALNEQDRDSIVADNSTSGSSAETTLESEDELPDDVVLVTADNDEELTFQAKLSAELRRQFNEIGAPLLFDGRFYPHQEAGYAWLRNLVDADSNAGAGGLLADDMGLGKTIQVIGLFAHLKSSDELGPSLLVVPKTVIRNWKEEIQNFCPAINDIYEYVGSNRRKDLEFLRQRDIIITTYTTLRIDQLLLGQVQFKVIVCDEAQYIKNYTTRRALACRGMNSQLRIALTATPVENSLDELWSIMDYSQPGHLGTLAEFRDTYAKPIESGDDGEGQRASRALLERLMGHYLRRTKEDELGDELPDKIIKREELPLTEVQMQLYQRIKKWYAQQDGRGKALGAIQALLRVCAHPLALTEEVAQEMGLDHPGSLAGVRKRAQELIEQSAKTQFLFEQLSEIQALGEKAIVFTRYRRLQLLLQPLIEEVTGIRPQIINGKVSGEKRHDYIQRFNKGDGFDVIIMSAGAAGVGVNVTGANHVIHLTREWNPAKENQATDRAYRIGQHKDVYVHTPVATHPSIDTIDVRLNKLLAAKQDLAQQVIRPSDSLGVTWKEMEDCLTN